MNELQAIQLDIEKEKGIMKPCESCEVNKSVLLFIPRQGGVWGIFHLCLPCWGAVVTPKPVFKFYTVYK